MLRESGGRLPDWFYSELVGFWPDWIRIARLHGNRFGLAGLVFIATLRLGTAGLRTGCFGLGWGMRPACVRFCNELYIVGRHAYLFVCVFVFNCVCVSLFV